MHLKPSTKLMLLFFIYFCLSLKKSEDKKELFARDSQDLFEETFTKKQRKQNANHSIYNYILWSIHIKGPHHYDDDGDDGKWSGSNTIMEMVLYLEFVSKHFTFAKCLVSGNTDFSQ